MGASVFSFSRFSNRRTIGCMWKLIFDDPMLIWIGRYTNQGPERVQGGRPDLGHFIGQQIAQDRIDAHLDGSTLDQIRFLPHMC